MIKMRIVGSLTTIPSRIFKIKEVLQSLLKQSYPLDKIYVNIPWKTLKNKSYKIPYFLEQMVGEKLVINRCIDYGPITKLIPTLDIEMDNNTYIITFDDDRIVHKNVVKILVQKINKYPNAALSFSGWNVGSFPFYFEKYDDNSLDIEVDWIQGCHSIIYRRGDIEKDELLTAFRDGPSYLFRHDDHRVSAYLEMKGKRRISIGKNAEKFFSPISACKIDAISGGDSLYNKIKFFAQVAKVSFYFKKLRLYYKNYHSFTRTFSFFYMKCIGIFIILCYAIIKIFFKH